MRYVQASSDGRSPGHHLPPYFPVMTRTKQAARRGGKRNRESDRSSGASSSEAAPSLKRPRSDGEVVPSLDDSLEPASGLAGIAFEDRDGDGDAEEQDAEEMDDGNGDVFKPTQSRKDEMRKELAELKKDLEEGDEQIRDVEAEGDAEEEDGDEMTDRDSDVFKPTQNMKDEMRKELAELEKDAEEGEEIPDVEAEEIGSSEEEEEEELEEGHGILPGGAVVRMFRPRRPQLVSRGARLMQARDGKDDEDLDPGDLDGDYVPGDDVAAPPAHVGVGEEETAAKKKKETRRSKKKKKRGFYNPRMWPAGAQVPGLYTRVNREAAFGRGITCLETGVSLDEDDNVKIGTLWENMRKHPLSGKRPQGCKERDRDDFLKACFRMGRFVEPERMAKLLGGGHRHEDYCRFVLAGFLGLLNIRAVRKKIQEGAPPQRETHSEVIVHADELYESDDELVRSADAVQERIKKARAEADSVEVQEEGAVVEVREILAEGDGDDELEDEPTRLFEELKLASNSEESFATVLSYVQRNYLTNMMAKDVDRDVFREFFKYAHGLGMTFETPACGTLPNSTLPKETVRLIYSSKKRYEDRRKWLLEPMPAPELGPGRSVKLGTIELWRHATKTLSSKHMARISLIQPNRLLDWLTFVTAQTNAAEKDKAYYTENNPVASIAPIPLLYLADLAADFALKILSVAAALADKEPFEIDSESRHVITEDDIRSSAALIVQDREKQRVAFHVFAEPPVDDMGFSVPALWPELVQRPLSEGEDVVLCERTPENSFRVPLNAVKEGRVVLGSLHRTVRRHLYTRPKMLQLMQGYKRNSHAEDEADKQADDLADEPCANPAADPVAQAAGEPVASSAADSATIPAADRAARSAADPAEDKGDPNVSSPSQPMPVTFNDHGESVFELEEADLNVSVNIAKLVTDNIGREVLSDRIRSLFRPPDEDEESVAGLSEQNLANSLNVTKKFKITPGTTVSYHRLGWLCLHALGQSVETEDDHLLGYGSTAHYTNFGGLGTSDRVTMNGPALGALTELADQLVRREAEILMACAEHDDGRPWIDRADVLLVNSVRKEKYIYSDV